MDIAVNTYIRGLYWLETYKKIIFFFYKLGWDVAFDDSNTPSVVKSSLSRQARLRIYLGG